MKRRTKLLIITPDENGKLEFTQKELEDLLDSAYEDGYQDGCAQQPFIYNPSDTKDTDELNIRWWENPTCYSDQQTTKIEGIPNPNIQIYGCVDNCMDTETHVCLDNCADLTPYNCLDNCMDEKMIYAHL